MNTGTIQVLLPSDDFDWIRGLLEDEPDAPRLHDPRNGSEYALLPESHYERFKAFFEDAPLSPAEREALFRAFGERAGWNDPEMNEYDTLPPGRDA